MVSVYYANTLSMLAPSSVDKGDVEKAADKPESEVGHGQRGWQ